ncbi:MAG: hypothetical protein MI922_30100 [Bacteroidales bacterium]|nr:hypothetical protein [Bacteroidales bacterium]
MIKYLKEKWGVKNIFDLIIILLVFSVTGMSAVYVKKWIFNVLSISSETPVLLRIMLYIVTIVPSYYMLLMIYGTIFGKRKFFWEFEKKSLGRLLLVRKSRN